MDSRRSPYDMTWVNKKKLLFRDADSGRYWLVIWDGVDMKCHDMRDLQILRSVGECYRGN